MFIYIYKICIFTITLCTTNLFNNNGIEIGTYKSSYHNGGIQFRMLAQKNSNKKSNGNTLMNIFLKDKNEKGSKTKKLDPQISSLVSLVDNMNITEEEKDKIKNLTLKYINSDNIVEKNKYINELQKYSKNEECKEHMNNYLMYLRTQNDIKYLKRNNFWNNIGIVTMTLFLIILLTVFILLGIITDNYGLFLTCILIFMTYICARFLPEIKICLKDLKETCTNCFKKKKQIIK
ncbi:MC-2TM Maurer's cleft two transmembrane protein [Plasmodium reichenowi]|uniref:MC-2TM Maurer's cleft two transmembrane protein n=1 Tax=Plasmodium reichenowi TaxID=5854 RepID=A0A151L2D9_PLARE|nr:MC-2TM Maurer's cleft two transmembrane protein [Plasmodium reichenowi]KYN93054.1 MC-2TM Maurer's cleft two transmembrane protein [Plasmodium reichenowi]